MKKYLFILAISLFPKALSAQITINNISFSAHNLVPLTFNYANINELLCQKVLNNSIRLDLCINSIGCNVSARVAYNTTPGPVPANWMSKKYLNSTSPTNSPINVNVPSDVSPLSSSDILLFTQPSDGSSSPKNYSYYYDLRLAPVASFVANGQYNFTILYTMTLL